MLQEEETRGPFFLNVTVIEKLTELWFLSLSFARISMPTRTNGSHRAKDQDGPSCEGANPNPSIILVID